MKCKECNNEITKKNQKGVSGVCKYKSKCKDCYRKYHREYAKKKAKAMKEATWFDVS